MFFYPLFTLEPIKRKTKSKHIQPIPEEQNRHRKQRDGKKGMNFEIFRGHLCR